MSSERYVMGADLGATHLRLVLATHAGEVVTRTHASLGGAREPQAVVAAMHAGLHGMLREAGLLVHQVCAVGVGAPGLTDVERGVVIATSYLLGWRDVPLRALVQDAFGLPAAVDNDVNLATLGEHWLGAGRGVQSFLFLAVGTGVGGGLVLRGEPWRGEGWMAGELGHMLVPGVPEAPLPLDAPGALERVAGGAALEQRWLALGREPLRASEIFALSERGDAAAAELLAHAARVLAYAAHNSAALLNLPLVILGGGVGAHPLLLPAVRAALAQRPSRWRPAVVASTLGTQAQVLGAARLAWLAHKGEGR